MQANHGDKNARNLDKGQHYRCDSVEPSRAILKQWYGTGRETLRNAVRKTTYTKFFSQVPKLKLSSWGEGVIIYEKGNEKDERTGDELMNR